MLCLYLGQKDKKQKNNHITLVCAATSFVFCCYTIWVLNHLKSGKNSDVPTRVCIRSRNVLCVSLWTQTVMRFCQMTWLYVVLRGRQKYETRRSDTGSIDLLSSCYNKKQLISRVSLMIATSDLLSRDVSSCLLWKKVKTTWSKRLNFDTAANVWHWFCSECLQTEVRNVSDIKLCSRWTKCLCTGTLIRTCFRSSLHSERPGYVRNTELRVSALVPS